MKKISVILLSIILVISLAGCGFRVKKADSALCGKWKANVNLSDKMYEGLKESLSTNINFNDFNIDVIFEFKADGTFEIKADADSVAKATEKAVSDIRTASEGILKKYADLLNLEGTVDKILTETGSSLDEALASIEEAFRKNLNSDRLFDLIAYKGKYKTDGNKLYFTQLSDGKFHDDIYDVFSIKDGQIILESTTDVDGFLTNLYPLTLKKF